MKITKKVLLLSVLCCLLFSFSADLTADEVLYLPFDTVYHAKPSVTPGWMGETMYSFYAQLSEYVAPVPGKVGNCFVFTGCNGVTVYDGDPTLDFGYDDFAISFWVKPDSMKTQATILDKRASNGVGYSFSLKNGRPCLYLCDSNYGAQEYMASNWLNLADNRWHHVAIYVDRGNTTGGKIYVDGLPHLTFDTTIHTGSLFNSSHLTLGKHMYEPITSAKKEIAEPAPVIRCNVKNFQGKLDEYRHFRYIPK